MNARMTWLQLNCFFHQQISKTVGKNFNKKFKAMDTVLARVLKFSACLSIEQKHKRLIGNIKPDFKD
ncbi:unnamed protein product [Blepharisma stoltei]|uniref:Uncharacterized protein n=1 Tax=Blepharisma stoltei TaxID=1481888 RepID=A0AAU9JVA4_9CILI|nr:unnamed protein product [Blepharisma stoltei]